ncbi:hypothetical protein J437_LFUL010499 [Ladona fulva]|uniref:DNA-directed DNA polymerase n=1 Tax=Ladona fulva TaxID=123851 RepID=A0A8K0KH36_LADFU|nr:hypothetical protein J437_LFUL010499 [Ladona fulva]
MQSLTPEEEVNFKNEAICHICKEELNADQVKDHDHLPGKYRGPAHPFCNLQYKMSNFLPVFIHNLSSYDGHFIVRELDYDDKKINVIPNTEEKYISFAKSIKNNFTIRFLDTCRFMPASLASLVTNLKTFKYTSEVFDLPLCPENKIPPGGKHKKLLTTLGNKEKYVVHYIHRIVEFDQSPWLKSYIDLNTNRRKIAKNEFEKDFYKIMF